MLVQFTRKSWTLFLSDSPSSRCLRVSQRRLLDEFHSIFYADARLVIVVPKTVDVLPLPVDVRLSSSWTRLLTCRCCASGVWSCFQLIVQLLDEVVDVPVVVHVLVYGMMKTVEFPQLPLAVGVSVPGQGRQRARCCARFLMSVDRVSSSSWVK